MDYLSHPELKISDHKPVTATFRTGVKVVDRAEHRRIYEGIMKELDRLENEFLPNVTVEPTEVILSDGVRFMEAKARFLTCANTGHVPVEFEFIQKDGCAEKFPPWLTVEPASGFVMPGKLTSLIIRPTNSTHKKVLSPFAKFEI